MNQVSPQPQYWAYLHWLWLNMLYSADELMGRFYRIHGVWYEFVEVKDENKTTVGRRQRRSRSTRGTNGAAL